MLYTSKHSSVMAYSNQNKGFLQRYSTVPFKDTRIETEAQVSVQSAAHLLPAFSL